MLYIQGYISRLIHKLLFVMKKILKKMNGLEAEDGIMTISQMKIDFQIDMI